MFNGHMMSVVSNLNYAMNEIMNADYFTVAAITTNDDYPPLPNIHYAGVLIPPTEMLMAWADGNPYILQTAYPQYLCCKEADDMIVAILAAMTRTNIILYIPQEEFNVFGTILLNHLYMTYGIIAQDGVHPFMFDQNKIPFLISKFFMNGIMDASDYLLSYPARYLLPDWVITKLAEELHPFDTPMPFEAYRDYFNNFVAAKGFGVLPPNEKTVMTTPIESTGVVVS